MKKITLCCVAFLFTGAIIFSGCNKTTLTPVLNSPAVVSTFVNSVDNPEGIATDASGNFYMQNIGGTFSYTAGGWRQLYWSPNAYPFGIAASGNFVYLVGPGREIVKADSNADFLPFTSPEFTRPFGVTADNSGNVYVTDPGVNQVFKISLAAGISILAGNRSAGSTDGAGSAASFNKPAGIAIDGNGNVYVADNGNNKIRKITVAGVVTTLAGTGNAGLADGTGTAASFNNPIGITVDGSGNVYVVDNGNNKIRKITANGAVTTLAGTGIAGSGDGIGSEASFNNPIGITIDKKGNLYVTDNGNNKIRMIVQTK